MGENYISCQLENGSINISEDVVNSMVKTAVAEVEGVAGLSNTAGAELAGSRPCHAASRSSSWKAKSLWMLSSPSSTAAR